ncbi:MAG: 30S ribosomal protein S6--L-glutamate ligase, partial [Saprospiraceae bacterium]|nr:30S ribosomal protein S6--L-glutamate ligase [Saprospiraceae bacterium]
MNIILLSRGSHLYSTQSLLEAGRGRGHSIRILDYLRCTMVLENKRSAIWYGNEPLHDIDAVIPRIGASITHAGAAVIRQFETLAICTLTSSQALLR